MAFGRETTTQHYRSSTIFYSLDKWDKVPGSCSSVLQTPLHLHRKVLQCLWFTDSEGFYYHVFQIITVMAVGLWLWRFNNPESFGGFFASICVFGGKNELGSSSRQMCNSASWSPPFFIAQTEEASSFFYASSHWRRSVLFSLTWFVCAFIISMLTKEICLLIFVPQLIRKSWIAFWKLLQNNLKMYFLFL